MDLENIGREVSGHTLADDEDWRIDTFMKARILKWGDSLSLRIPKRFAEELHLREDSSVDLTIRNGRLIVVPIVEPACALEDLVRQINHQTGTSGQTPRCTDSSLACKFIALPRARSASNNGCRR